MTRRISFGMIAAIVVVVFVILVGGLSTRSSAGAVGLTIAVPQKGSPVTILSASSTAGQAFLTVRLRNDSALAIRAITMGVMLHPVGSNGERRILITGSALRFAMAPKGIVTAPSKLWTGGGLESYRPKYPGGLVAELGVVAVAFENGTQWTFDSTRARFGPGSASAAAFSLRPCNDRSWWAMAFGDGAAYQCVRSENKEWCEVQNQGRDCTDHICEAGPPDQCPYQKCELKEQ